MTTENYDNTIKIGSRILPKDSMNILLPNHENIYDQIKEIRDNAKLLRERLEGTDDKHKKFAEIVKEEPEFVKHHNNVFSILGERGSGKTSVLLTIKNKIMEGIKGEKRKNIRKYDTVLPIIVPQDMDEESDSLGWIIGFFAEIVKKVQEDFQEDKSIFNYKSSSRNCPLCGTDRAFPRADKINYVGEAFKKVEKAYFLRKEEYKKSLSDVGSKRDYVDLSSDTLSKDIELAKCFKEFIDEYVEYQRHTRKNCGNEDALIYIFFDDVDISTRKCLNVLETIIRFLSHSNIVIFVSGNYITFEETIIINYLYNDKILDAKLIEKSFTTDSVKESKTALEIRKELAYDYLKKVLSPALRYNLKKITDEEKVNFKYSSQENTEYKSLFELLKETFKLEETNFLMYESIHGKDKNFVIPTLFKCFDNKPRGLMNVYYYLNSMSKKIEKTDDIHKIWTAEELNRFLDIIIDSSSELNIYKENIKSVIKIKKDPAEDKKIYIDVRYVDIFQGEIEGKKIIKKRRKLDVLSLGMLFDGICCALNKEDYKKIFNTTRDNDEVGEIRDFLNKQLLNEKSIYRNIISKMENPFEMLYVFSVALNYPVRTERKKENILAIGKTLIEVSLEERWITKETIKIEKGKAEEILKYIKMKKIEEEMWLSEIKEICEIGSELLALDVEDELDEILHSYLFIEKEEIVEQNRQFFKETKNDWNNVKASLKKIEKLEEEEWQKKRAEWKRKGKRTRIEARNLGWFNGYFAIREQIEKKEFLRKEKHKQYVIEMIEEMHKRVEDIEKLGIENREQFKIIFENKQKQEERLKEFEKIVARDNNMDKNEKLNKVIRKADFENEEMKKLDVFLKNLQKSVRHHIDKMNMMSGVANYFKEEWGDSSEYNVYDYIKNFLIEDRKMNTLNFFYNIKAYVENGCIDELNQRTDYLVKENKIMIRDLFWILEQILIQEAEEYNENLKNYNIMNELQDRIMEKGKDKKEELEMIYRYLGRDVIDLKDRIINEDEEKVSYDCNSVDAYYFLYQIISVLKKNKMQEIDLKEDHVRRIRRALKYKDDELKNNKFILIADDLKGKLEKLKNEKIYNFGSGDAIKEKLIYVKDFMDFMGSIDFYLMHGIPEYMNEEDVRFRRVLEKEEAYIKEIAYELRKIKKDIPIEPLTTKEKMHFRIYALLYAIIKKETTPKEVYEEKEEFYKELLKKLDDYNKDLYNTAFKLLD
ncbi:hypothetical protein [Crassaminicella profunda]|uniref:hypothetical protein n=1 Tax=Crassaminicella profunda TaxID=1286698 RepID=UPI001CA67505|nr:hypothetical protein [Crassaminicella profunda]QZY54496.1 hypothetical protein K7H06_15840 [Crassaminicella profunda]